MTKASIPLTNVVPRSVKSTIWAPIVEAEQIVAERLGIPELMARLTIKAALGDGAIDARCLGATASDYYRPPIEFWRMADIAADGTAISLETLTRVRWIEVPRSDIDKLWPAPAPSEENAGNGQFKDPGGAPPQYDWDAFDREMMRIANTPDGLPARAILTRKMKEWCISCWSKEPSDSMVRNRIKRLYPTQ